MIKPEIIHETTTQVFSAKRLAPQLKTEISSGNFQTLQRALNNLTYSETSQDLFSNALNILIALTCADSATFFQVDEDTRELLVAAIQGDENSQHLLGLRIPRQEAMLQAALEENEPIIIGDLHEDTRWLRVASPTSAARMQNLISLPLVTMGRLIGVVQIYNFHQADLNLLNMTRERLALEMDRFEAFNTSQRNNRQLEALVQALGEMGGTLDRKQILQTVLEQSATLVDAERTSIYINNPGSNKTSYQIAYQPDWDAEVPTKVSVETNRSVVTVPLQTHGKEPGIGASSRRFGGLMAIKPNQSSFSPDEIALLNSLTEGASNFLQAAEVFEGLQELFFDVIETMVAALDAKDTYTQGHSKRVSEYCVLIAQGLGLDTNAIQNIRIGSMLHDVGKIGIPDEILLKKGKLTPQEFEVVKSHPLTGWKIMREVGMLEPMLPAIIEHHEKLDGSGYPYALQGDQISLMGRIVAVADVFDAMTSDRPYRDAIPVPDVLKYLDENCGILFDHQCVKTLKRIIFRNNEPSNIF